MSLAPVTSLKARRGASEDFFCVGSGHGGIMAGGDLGAGVQGHEESEWERGIYGVKEMEEG